MLGYCIDFSVSGREQLLQSFISGSGWNLSCILGRSIWKSQMSSVAPSVVLRPPTAPASDGKSSTLGLPHQTVGASDLS